MNREEWLHALAAKLAPWFQEAGHPIPASVRLACGFPSQAALARRKRRIGECWAKAASADAKTIHIFISPVLANELEVAETVLHELIHAALPFGVGHKGPFVKMAKGFGLQAPWTATTASPELKARLNALLSMMPERYPHAALQAVNRRGSKGSRLLKVACPECDYTVRVTRMWLDKGLPTCPCGTEMEEL